MTLATERTDLFPSGPMRQSIELRNPHACATPYAAFYAHGGISGVVVGKDGQPVAQASVSLRAAEIDGQEQIS